MAYLDKYYAMNKFIASGRKVPRTGGVILMVAESRAAVDEIIKQDPFYQEDIAEYDVVEFTPSKTAEGLAQLITYDEGLNI